MKARVNRRNYYRILHVQPDAPPEIIKSSYRTLMQRLKMHPDLGGDHWNAALINEAYAVLIDPAKRAAYDAGLEQATARRPATAEAQQDAPGPRTASQRGQASAGRRGGQCPFCHAAHDEPAADACCPSCGSPLSRPPATSGRAAWLRAVERVPQDMPLRFWTGWPAARPRAGRLLDLSLTGLRFATAAALAPDQFLKIDCERFQAIARVIHSRASGTEQRVGAEFLTLRFLRSRGAFVSDEA
ncbi:MAG: hypothetical protein D6727_01615 [Gammaproteobacteria bacterium]|nr:MAG: hypothetical protein D6727_01615 [Gammaproteobacteria bacterium]